MKNTLTVLVLLSFILPLNLGCSSDDSTNPKDDIIQKLLGEWTLFSYEGGIAGLPETPTEDDITISFDEDGNYKKFEDGQLTFEGTFEIDFFAANGQENILLKTSDTNQWRLFFENERLSLDQNAINGADGFIFHYYKLELVVF
ncbi:hypothetical protein ACFQ1M_16750 [Sungkyunkwania multivorans]|uniref:Lipocalin-like domain-containing protein n=1 Tax=Sungkyunkwania multivorans TaxID=1173618 RepID=A0ABW3D4M2_9FLAO